MAITVDTTIPGQASFDSADVTGNETILAAPGAGKHIGIDYLSASQGVAGELWFSPTTSELRRQVAANGGFNFLPARTWWLPENTALTVDQQNAGGVSGELQYRIGTP